MRTARATVVVGLGLGVGLGVALAPADASADPPRVSARLVYARGPGGEACPAEPTSLRAELTRRMGYDPFARADAPERLTVSVVGQGGGFRARVERFNAAGVSTWSETFPARPLRGGCAALFSPLASYVFALFLTPPGSPEAQPPEPAPTPPPPAPLVPPPAPPAPPEVLNVPNPARSTARNVAIVSYAAAGAFLGLGIAWSVDAQSKANSAQALSTQSYRAGGVSKCQSADAPDSYCSSLLGAWQSRDAALNLRNGWFVAAGVSAAVGAVATAWALNLPTTIKGQPQTQVSIRPDGLVLSGTF
jgi:hypothetical protein